MGLGEIGEVGQSEFLAETLQGGEVNLGGDVLPSYVDVWVVGLGVAIEGSEGSSEARWGIEFGRFPSIVDGEDVAAVEGAGGVGEPGCHS